MTVLSSKLQALRMNGYAGMAAHMVDLDLALTTGTESFYNMIPHPEDDLYGEPGWWDFYADVEDEDMPFAGDGAEELYLAEYVGDINEYVADVMELDDRTDPVYMIIRS